MKSFNVDTWTQRIKARVSSAPGRRRTRTSISSGESVAPGDSNQRSSRLTAENREGVVNFSAPVPCPRSSQDRPTSSHSDTFHSIIDNSKNEDQDADGSQLPTLRNDQQIPASDAAQDVEAQATDQSDRLARPGSISFEDPISHDHKNLSPSPDSDGASNHSFDIEGTTSSRRSSSLEAYLSKGRKPFRYDDQPVVIPFVSLDVPTQRLSSEVDASPSILPTVPTRPSSDSGPVIPQAVRSTTPSQLTSRHSPFEHSTTRIIMSSPFSPSSSQNISLQHVMPGHIDVSKQFHHSDPAHNHLTGRRHLHAVMPMDYLDDCGPALSSGVPMAGFAPFYWDPSEDSWPVHPSFHSVDVNVTGPISPSEVRRYQRKIKPSDKAWHDVYIHPFTTLYRDDDLTHEEHRRAGWIQKIHPEGAVYYLHIQRRVFTDAPLVKLDYLYAVEEAFRKIKGMIGLANRDLAIDTELVIELTKVGEGEGETHQSLFDCGYYLVSHDTRSVFWPEDFMPIKISGNVKNVNQLSHLGHAMESQYWTHCEFFPSYRPIPRRIVDELEEIVHFAIAETVTSDTPSLSPFDSEELSRIAEFARHARADERNQRVDHTACTISRFMRIFARNRFYNFHGQISARLYADQNLYQQQTRQNSMLIRIFSPMMFNVPEVYLKDLQVIWVDQLLNYIPWKKFIFKCKNEWRGYTLFSTVILNANIAFLALANVSPQIGTAHTYPQTAAEVLSYASTVASLGSVVLGLVLPRRNHTGSRKAADSDSYLLTKVTSHDLGLEALAIVLSLPYGLLLWGMIFFIAAFIALTYQSTGILTRAMVGAVGGITVVLVLSPMAMSRRLYYWIPLFKDGKTSSSGPESANNNRLRSGAVSNPALNLQREWGAISPSPRARALVSVPMPSHERPSTPSSPSFEAEMKLRRAKEYEPPALPEPYVPPAPSSPSLKERQSLDGC